MRLESNDMAQKGVGFPPAARERVRGERQPEIDIVRFDASKAAGRHADDLERLAPDAKRASKDVRSPAEPLLPERMTEDRESGPRLGSRLVGSEHPAEFGTRP